MKEKIFQKIEIGSAYFLYLVQLFAQRQTKKKNLPESITYNKKFLPTNRLFFLFLLVFSMSRLSAQGDGNIIGEPNAKVGDVKHYQLFNNTGLQASNISWSINTNGTIQGANDLETVNVLWTSANSASFINVSFETGDYDEHFFTLQVNVTNTPPVTSNENYIYTVSPLVPTTDITTLTDNEKLESIQYFDGLGRAKQTIGIRAGGDQQDIVTHFTYDQFGRQKKEYLPYIVSNNGGEIQMGDVGLETNTFYQNRYPDDFLGLSTNAVNAYSEKHLEDSPLNRVLEQGAPGKDWKVNTTSNTDHTIKFEYLSNRVTDYVKEYRVSFINNDTQSPELEDTGVYEAGELYKTITKDENWQPNQTHPKNHTTEEYKNKQGQVVLKRTFDDGKWHDTYYVYDDFGNLTYVLPPKIMTYASIHQAFRNISYSGQVTTFFNTSNPMNDAAVTIYGNPYYGDEDKIMIQFGEDTEDMTPGPLKSGIVADLSDLGATLPNIELGDVYVKNNGSSVVGGKAKIIDGNIHFTNTNANIQNDEYFYQYFIINLPDHQVNYTSNITQSNLNDLAYQYRYDSENRLIEKKMPGKGWEYIVYDALDRPILVQDSNMRDYDKWLLTKYDAFGRVAYTAIYKQEWDSREELQNFIDTYYTSSPLYESKVSTGTGYSNTYYTNNSKPFWNIQEVLTVNYYDDYSFDMDGLTIPATGTDNVPIINYNNTDKIKTKGLTTGTKIKVLTKNEWITTVNGYDEDGRVIYSASKNKYLNTTDITTIEFNFTGKITKSTSRHKKTGKNDIVTVDTFTYDHANRLLSQKQKINSQSEELIVLNTYDNLGQLESKKVGGDVAPDINNSSGLQTVDYTYNVRGWLRQINDPNNLGDDVFGFGINYNNPQFPNANYAAPLYNGNISHTYWKTSSNSNLEQYGYKYDALNRMKDATFAENSSVNNKFNESIEDYDRNGNILNLHRKGLFPNLNFAYTMDLLQYTYQGNKLMGVKDSYSNSTSNSMGGFVDGNISGSDYYYDSNGNMRKDLNKGIHNIAYNHLNLPTYVSVNDGGSNVGSIFYIYDANGVKLEKKVDRSSGSVTTQYAGNYVYEENNLQFFNHTEGYVKIDNEVFNYVYQIKDHLGNIRVSYTDNNDSGSIDSGTEIVEESNYYPFGLKHKRHTSIFNSGAGNPLAQKFGFGGKELSKELGLEWYDFGARNYNASLGRWMNLDPMAEIMENHSPFNYGFNNPNYYIDYDGRVARGLLDPYIIFNGKDNKIYIYDDNDTPDDKSDDVLLGTFDAHNITVKKSQKWEDGTYKMFDKNSRRTRSTMQNIIVHKSFGRLNKSSRFFGGMSRKIRVKMDSYNGTYGDGGIYRAYPFTQTNGTYRAGMAIHAGRGYKPFLKRPTEGCIRTTPEAMIAIDNAILDYGPLTTITVEDNLSVTPRPTVKSLVTITQVPITQIPIPQPTTPGIIPQPINPGSLPFNPPPPPVDPDFKN